VIFWLSKKGGGGEGEEAGDWLRKETQKIFKLKKENFTFKESSNMMLNSCSYVKI
jgi:hypothetical protein